MNKGRRISVLNSFVEGLREKNVGVEFSNEDKELIGWQLLRYDEILFRKLERLFAQSGFKKFLLVIQKKERICWYDVSLDKIVVNLYHKPDNPEFDNTLQTVGKIAQGMSPTIQKTKKGC